MGNHAEDNGQTACPYTECRYCRNRGGAGQSETTETESRFWWAKPVYEIVWPLIVMGLLALLALMAGGSNETRVDNQGGGSTPLVMQLFAGTNTETIAEIAETAKAAAPSIETQSAPQATPVDRFIAGWKFGSLQEGGQVTP